MVLDPYSGFLWGFFGGFAANFLGAIRLYRENPDQIPQWIKSPPTLIFAIIVFLGLGAIGGILVVAYISSKQEISSAILAINIGASAPLFFSATAQRIPPVDPGNNN